MIGQLPKFSFKRYLRTIAVDVDSADKLVSTVLEAIRDAATQTSGDPVRLLVFTIFVDDPERGPVQYELRAWVAPDKVTTVSNFDESFDPARAYRVIIEEFEVAAIAASFDADSASHLGFPLHILPLDSGLEERIRELLGLAKPARPAQPEPVEEAEASREGAGVEAVEAEPETEEEPAAARLYTITRRSLIPFSLNRPRPRVQLRREEREEARPAVVGGGVPGNGGDGIAKCLARIWEECVYGDCSQPSDFRAALENDGFAVVGKGAEYVCVIRSQRRHCRYFVIVMGPGKIETDCLRSVEEAVRLLEERVRSKGYLTVLAS